MDLSSVSIHAWIQKYQLKTEKGELIEFRDHPFLFDIYSDWSPLQVIMKPAQVGMTTLEIVKSIWGVRRFGLDSIFTQPADSDVLDFVGGKVNRIIAQNPILREYTKDRDTIEQKQVGKNLIYYRGTWSKKVAMMVSSDWLIHDEVDASKQDVISDYESRVQHSKHKWRWYF